MKRVMQMFRLDSQRHINIIQAAIEIIQGEDVFIEDRAPLKETFKKHLEAEALKKANGLLRKQWVEENQGLKNLLQMWRDDEKRHHAALKTITSKPYIRMTSNDFVSLFRDEKIQSVQGTTRVLLTFLRHFYPVLFQTWRAIILNTESG